MSHFGSPSPNRVNQMITRKLLLTYQAKCFEIFDNLTGVNILTENEQHLRGQISNCWIL